VLALALALALTQTPQHRLRMQPNLPRVASTAAFQLNGSGTPTSLQCTSDPLYTEAPVQGIGNTRASSAYCEKSDGTMVLMSSNTLRRERMGLLVEPASANLIGASGADARDLTVAGWTRRT
jgi:hypothetical protein